MSVDWLLGLENAPTGRQEITQSTAFAEAGRAGLVTPLDRWKREAEGRVIRYVPSTIPEVLHPGEDGPGPHDDAALSVEGVRDPHLEICIAFEALHGLARRTGPWRDLSAEQAAARLRRMADAAARAYPGIRLHVYDGRRAYSPPFVVFGQQRAALFLGETYLVVTAADQVEAFAAKFDALVRLALVGPDRAPALLLDLAAEAEAG